MTSEEKVSAYILAVATILILWIHGCDGSFLHKSKGDEVLPTPLYYCSR